MNHHQLDAPNPLNPFWMIQHRQGEHLAIVCEGKEVRLGGASLRLRDDALTPGAEVKDWLSTSGYFVCALVHDLVRAEVDRRATEAVNQAELNLRRNSLRAEAEAFNAQIKPPVKWAVGIKDVLSSLSERSQGDGRNKAAVHHVFLLEPLSADRIAHKAHDFHCTADADTNGKAWSGKMLETHSDGDGEP